MRLKFPRRDRVTRKDRELATAMAWELAGDGTPEQAANLAGWLDHMAGQMPDDPRSAHLRLLADAMYEAWGSRVAREDRSARPDGPLVVSVLDEATDIAPLRGYRDVLARMAADGRQPAPQFWYGDPKAPGAPWCTQPGEEGRRPR